MGHLKHPADNNRRTGLTFVADQAGGFGKGENFAGTFVGSGFVDQGVFIKAVAKFRGLVMIVFGNDSDGFIKTDGDIVVYFFKERGK